MPSLRCCSILSLFLAFTPALLFANQSKELKDLNKAHIVIEDLGAEALDLGLSTEDLNAVTLVALKRDLPSLAIRDGGSTFYVRVTGFQTSCGFTASIEVYVRR